MSTARLLADPGRLIRAEDYNKSIHRSVVCRSCRCTVYGTSAYERNQNGLQIQVRAFFSVSAGVRHKPHCRFNVERTIDLLVARSSKVTTLDISAIPLLVRGSGTKKAEFRLHILMECLRAGTPARLVAPNAKLTGGHYIRSPRVLRSYLNTTRSLLAFIARFEGDNSLGEHIALKYEKQTIKWRDFFFDQHQQKELLEKLMAMDGKLEANHPVAFVVKTRDSRVEKPSADTPLKLPRTTLTFQGERLSLFTTLYVGPDFLVPLIQAWEYTLVCATPRRLKPISRVTLEEQKRGWNNSLGLFVPIYSRAQVASFRPQGT